MRTADEDRATRAATFAFTTAATGAAPRRGAGNGAVRSAATVAPMGRRPLQIRSASPMISVVVPALNEAETIEQTVRSIPRAELAARGFDTEVVVVDNGSEDGTARIAARAGARVVSEPARGYGLAYRRGFREARGDIICTMDADLTYPADALPELVDRLLGDDLDFINTDRFAFLHNGVMSRRNRIGNACLSRAARILFGLPFKDSQSGMWVFRSDLLDRMDLRASGMALSEEIKIEAAWRLKARCAEVPIRYGHRRGESKLRVWRDGIGNLLHLARRRFG